MLEQTLSVSIRASNKFGYPTDIRVFSSLFCILFMYVDTMKEHKLRDIFEMFWRCMYLLYDLSISGSFQ